MRYPQSIASRARDIAWNWAHGRDAQGRQRTPAPTAGKSLAGKLYLPSEPAPPTDRLAVAAAAERSDSKLPARGATPRVGLFLALTVIASTWVCGPSLAASADDRWLAALALVESSHDSSAIGDGGAARGAFQFHRSAWEVARRVDPRVVEYHSGSTNLASARLAAAAYLTWLRQRFVNAGVPNPSSSQLYAAYNCGFTGFKKKYGLDVKRTPRTTQRACARLEAALRKP